MKKGWQTKKLSEVCEKITDGTHQTPTYFDDGVLFLSSRNVTSGTIDWENVKYIDDKQHGEMQRRVSPRLNDILLAKNGTTGVAAMVDRDVPFDIYVSLALLRPLAAVRPTFLLHFINSPLAKQQFTKRLKGIGVPNLHLEEIREVEIPVPPLAEQQRIVGLLDEAFDGLATAKANAEKNIQNARALFESHLQSVFTQRGPGWVEKPFEDCIEDVKYTAKIQRKEFLEEGEFPIVSQEAEFTNGYWDNAADVFKVTSPVVIFGDHTQVLKYIDFDFVLGADGVKLLPPKPFLNPKFFFYALRSAPLKSLGYARHYRLLKELQIGYPDTNAQVAIAKKLDALEAETQRLTRLYERKHAALEALKKSLLHQAFTGQL